MTERFIFFQRIEIEENEEFAKFIDRGLIMKYDLRVVKVSSLNTITETQTSLLTKLGTTPTKTQLRCLFDHSENPNLAKQASSCSCEF